MEAVKMSKEEALMFLANHYPKVLAGVKYFTRDKLLMLNLIKNKHQEIVRKQKDNTIHQDSLEKLIQDRQECFMSRHDDLTHDPDFLIQVGLIDLNILVHDDLIKKLKSDYITQVLFGIIQQKPEVLADLNLWFFFKRDYTIYFSCLYAVSSLNQQKTNVHYAQFIKQQQKIDMGFFSFASTIALLGSLGYAGVYLMPQPFSIALIIASILMISFQIRNHYQGSKYQVFFKPSELEPKQIKQTEQFSIASSVDIPLPLKRRGIRWPCNYG
jgi:hypothetical protein